MLTILPLLATLLCQLGAEPIVTSDLLRLRQITSIDVARDSSRAVFAVQSFGVRPAEGTEASPRGPSHGYRSHLYVLGLFDDDAAPRQLTFGQRNDRAPRLSPDGRRIAFLRGGEAGEQALLDEDEDGGAGKPQIWILDLGGGEARQVTALEQGAGPPQWSPDGRRLLFTARVGLDELGDAPPYPSERPGRAWNDAGGEGVTPRPDGTRDEIRAWLRRNAEGDDPVVIHRLDFQEELGLRDAPKVRHVFVVDAGADGASEPRRITGGFLDVGDPVFTPDGRAILYTARRSPDVHPDRDLEQDLRRVDVDGTNDVVFLTLDGWTVRDPEPSVDGSMVAFAARPTDEPSDRPWQLGIVTAGPDGVSPPVWMTEPQTFEASVRSFTWMTARTSLVFTAPWQGGVPLSTISPGLLKPAAVASERDGLPIGVGPFDVGGGTIVYAETSWSNPCALRVRDGTGDRLAWNPNAWIEEKSLARPRMTWIDRPDGTRIQTWIMEPTDRVPGEPYPLCLQIHGGPSAMWGPGERTMWHEFQLLCSWGYGVVYANPRGSGGYGYDFQRANFQDWGETPAGDVLAAVDHALATETWVDPERLVVTGGSYAGYLTAWIVAHDHRFKAAVAQRGVYDLATFFGEGNAWRLVEWEMGGWPWDPRYKDIIRRNSPFTYVNQIRTPLLIMHASRDLRTGVSQSEMLYRGLKALDRPVEYVRYPRTGHDLSRSGNPRRRMDRLNRIIEFFERHIANPRHAPVAGDEAGNPAPTP